MVSAALMSLVALFVALLFNSAKTSFELGSTRISGDQKAREVIAKLTPYLSSAFSPAPAGGGAIYDPLVGPASQSVTFVSTEDWLDSAYPSLTTSARLLPGGPGFSFNFFAYRIRFTGTGGNLILEKVNPQSNLGPWTAFNPPAPRTVARSIRDVKLNNVLFQRLYGSSNVIQVEVQLVSTDQARTADRSRFRTVDTTVRANINVAGESLR
jgi:hypothetical protein